MKPSGIQRIINLVGNTNTLATAMGVTTQAVYLWRLQGYVSPERAVQMEARYGVSRYDLMKPSLAKVLRKTEKSVV